MNQNKFPKKEREKKRNKTNKRTNSILECVSAHRAQIQTNKLCGQSYKLTEPYYDQLLFYGFSSRTLFLTPLNFFLKQQREEEKKHTRTGRAKQ